MPAAVAVISTSPAASACTTPRVSSTVAICSLLDVQRRRTPGTVSPDGLRGEPASVNDPPTSTTLGGAKISMAATYGFTVGVGAGAPLVCAGTRVAPAGPAAGPPPPARAPALPRGAPGLRAGGGRGGASRARRARYVPDRRRRA